MEFLIAPAIWNTLHNQRKECINQCEESPEVKLGEEQRTVLIKGQYVVEEVQEGLLVIGNW